METCQLRSRGGALRLRKTEMVVLRNWREEPSDPVGQALVKLTSIVQNLAQTKPKGEARSLDDILDNYGGGSGGGADNLGMVFPRHAQAYRHLRKSLVDHPAEMQRSRLVDPRWIDRRPTTTRTGSGGWKQQRSSDRRRRQERRRKRKEGSRKEALPLRAWSRNSEAPCPVLYVSAAALLGRGPGPMGRGSPPP